MDYNDGHMSIDEDDLDYQDIQNTSRQLIRTENTANVKQLTNVKKINRDQLFSKQNKSQIYSDRAIAFSFAN